MGILAVFTIPPLFQTPASNVANKQNALARDVGFMIITAYERYKVSVSSVQGSTTPGAITNFMNYVSADTTSQIDGMGTSEANHQCSSAEPCLKLHNGGSLFVNNVTDGNFGGTSTTNMVFFQFDPDGGVGGSRSLKIALYYDGYIETRDTLRSGSQTSHGAYGLTSGADPSWFTGF